MKTASTTFSSLLALIKADIVALKDEDNAKLFYKVGSFVVRPKALKTPACAIWPANDPDEANGITNISTFTGYRFKVGFAFKGTKDADIIDKALYCRDKIKSHFEANPDYSVSVPGYIQTLIENNELTLDDESPEGALLFGSGITIICQVQRII